MNCWKMICWEFSTSIKQFCKENQRYRRRSNIKKKNLTVDSFPAMKRDMSPWIISMYQYWAKGFPGGSAGKESACNAGNLGWISGLGRSAGEGVGYPLQYSWASLVAQLAKNLPAMQVTLILSLGWEDSLGKGTATHSISARRIPGTV